MNDQIPTYPHVWPQPLGGVLILKSTPIGGGLKYTTSSNPPLTPYIPVQGEVGHTIDRCITSIILSRFTDLHDDNYQFLAAHLLEYSLSSS